MLYGDRFLNVRSGNSERFTNRSDWRRRRRRPMVDTPARPFRTPPKT